MRTKLIGYLNSVFDKDPYQVLALRISHSSGANWTIKDRKLTVQTAAGTARNTIDLRGHTIESLVNQIRYLGYSTPYINRDFIKMPADILLDGSGKETSHNGDHVYTFSSTLWAILNVVGLMLVETKENAVDKAIKMAYFDTATQFWLDLWAGYFGSTRKHDEVDADFLARSIAETVRIRNTPNSLKNAVKDITGIDVFIHEHWRDYYSEDNPENADGTWCKFEAIVYQDITEEQQNEIVSVLERNRPIGVLFDGVVRALQFMLREDIDYEYYLDQHEELADWHVDHSWNNESHQWNERVYQGLTISVAMS